MNLLQKQGFFNSLILYAGIMLGFFNGIILFQRVLSIEEIGFFSLTTTVLALYTQIAGVGINNIIIKFFPYYRTDDKKHGGFVTFAFWWTLISFIAFTVLFVVSRNNIIDHYKDREGSQLLVRYFYYLIPLALFTLTFSVIESFALTVFKNVFSSFLREVGLRLFTTASVFLIAAGLIDYHAFILIYVLASALMVLILWIYIIKDGNFKFSRIEAVVKNDRWKFVNYGVFTLLSNSSFVMIQNLDTLMLSLLTKQSFIYVGIYGTFFAIAVVISMPARALSRTSLQIVSQAWASNDVGKIGKVYYKTSVVQMLIGCLLFTGLVVNKQFIIMLLHKPEYAGVFNVFIVVGVAFLVDMTGGLNNYIINLSKYYRLTTVFYVAGVILCLVCNLVLIPRMGMMGAAISYLVTMLVLNFTYWLFIKVKFGLQPFGKAHLYALLVFAVCMLIGIYLPRLKNVYADMLYRSVIVGIVYAFLAYILKISEDINLIFDRILKRGA
ncbi:lipopolysaccharide biosynthesis protein [Mucilaginibacter celer]|uniref:Uncharacterized protein n=1 Tax=Mucilaginibacter celer TaxID=2305508 RepID=A0A494VUM3_9SPHI|nr:polysaccharide biosynthesis C-terminal domain-containing protein [Mucilaginibacter celer]AYL98684.1 hypothetical protein HYN43_026930 [Mucilaginibacter celer]